MIMETSKDKPTMTAGELIEELKKVSPKSKIYTEQLNGIRIEIARVVGVTNFGKGISSEKVLLNIF